MLSTSKGKEPTPAGSGHRVRPHHQKATFKRMSRRFDLILDTISAPHDYNAYLGLLKVDGPWCSGGPAAAGAGAAFALIGGGAACRLLHRRHRETQEMLDHCAQHGIVSDVGLSRCPGEPGLRAMLKNDVVTVRPRLATL